ncbi:MAG: hypothetical protein WC637_08595 [Victivallales bacterium]|jgi:hypothetical protein
MRLLILSLLIFFSITLSAWGLILETTDGNVYENVSILNKTPSGLEIKHSKGENFIDFSILPEDIQKKYKYDPIVAKKYEDELKAKKYDKLLKALVKQADEHFTDDGIYIVSKAHVDRSSYECVNCGGSGRIITYNTGSVLFSKQGGSIQSCGTCEGAGTKIIQKVVPDKIAKLKQDSNLADAYRELAIKVTKGELSGGNLAVIKYTNISSAFDPVNEYKCDEIRGNAYLRLAIISNLSGEVKNAKLYYVKAIKYLPNDETLKSELEKVTVEVDKLIQKEQVQGAIDSANSSAYAARQEAEVAKQTANRVAEKAKSDVDRAEQSAKKAKQEAEQAKNEADRVRADAEWERRKAEQAKKRADRDREDAEREAKWRSK